MKKGPCPATGEPMSRHGRAHVRPTADGRQRVGTSSEFGPELDGGRYWNLAARRFS